MYFNQLGYKEGAEIGVADGRYSEILCQKIPGLFLHAVDPWAKYDGNWRSDEYQDKAYYMARTRLRPYQADIMRHTSLVAAEMIPNGSLDFVFIDGAHDFNNVMLDVILWTPKVRKGGIVSGHDYYVSPKGTVQVIPAVDAYVKQHNIQLNVIPRFDGGHPDDKAPCWWFMK